MKLVADVRHRVNLKFAFAIRCRLKELERTFSRFALIGNVEYIPLFVKILDGIDVAGIRSCLQISPLAQLPQSRFCFRFIRWLLKTAIADGVENFLRTQMECKSFLGFHEHSHDRAVEGGLFRSDICERFHTSARLNSCRVR